MRTIEGEKKVFGIILGLIVVIVVILGILISLNENTSKGTSSYGGSTIKDLGIAQNAPQIDEPSIPTRGNQGTPVPPSIPRDTDYTITNVDDKEIIVVTPFELSASFERARRLVLSSQCYAFLGDVREITAYSNLVGHKFIADLQPNNDYTLFQATVVVKLMQERTTVYYAEYPIIVDLTSNRVVDCKGRPQVMLDIYGLNAELGDYYYEVGE